MKPRRWPKAANEVRHDAIMEAGAIRVRTRNIRQEFDKLREAIRTRDLQLALVIIGAADNIVQVIEKSAEIIVIKLENAKADEE